MKLWRDTGEALSEAIEVDQRERWDEWGWLSPGQLAWLNRMIPVWRAADVAAASRPNFPVWR